MSLRTSIRRDTCLCWCRDSKELSIVFSTNWPKIRNIKLPWRNSHAKAWLQNSPLYAWTVLLLESGQRWFETMDFMWFLSCQFQLRIPEAEIYIGDQISFKSFLLANLRDLHFNCDRSFNHFQLSLRWLCWVNDKSGEVRFKATTKSKPSMQS